MCEPFWISLLLLQRTLTGTVVNVENLGAEVGSEVNHSGTP